MNGELLQAICEYLGIPVVVVSAAVLLAGAASSVYNLASRLCDNHEKNIESGGSSLRKEREILRRTGSWTKTYFQQLERIDGVLSQWLGDRAWSVASYEIALRLSFLLVFAAIFVFWVFTGKNTTGIAGALAEDVGAYTRTLMLLQVCTGAVIVFLGVRPHAPLRRFWLASGLILLVIFLFNTILHKALFLLVGSVVSLISLASFQLALFSGAIAYSYGIFGGLYSFGFGLVGVSAVVINRVIEHAYEHHKKRNEQPFFIFNYNLALLVGVYYLAWQTKLFILVEWQKAAVVYALVVPFIIAFFNWVSIGSARRVLKEVVANKSADPRRLVVSWLLVIGASAGIVILLALTIVLMLQLMNLLSGLHGGSTWVDVAGLLAAMRQNAGDPSLYGIYIMIASPLLPLLLNIGAATAGVAAWSVPNTAREKYLARLKKPGRGDKGQIRNVARFLTRVQLTGWGLATAAFVLLGILALWGLPWLGRLLLWLCDGIVAAL